MPRVCEYGNEPSGYIKGKKYTDQLNWYQTMRKDSPPQRRLVKLESQLLFVKTVSRATHVVKIT
jgi:hypothetical protein